MSGRSRRSTWWGFALTLGGLAVAGAALVAMSPSSSHLGSPRQGNASAPPSVPVSIQPTVPNFEPVPTVPNPSQPFWTDVMPNSPIAFPNVTDGWRIGGQGTAPHLVGDLASPKSAELYWPGDSLLHSTDAGRTWTSVVTDPTGLWGLTFLDTAHGWVVGVSTLRSTSDSGKTWTLVSEPADTHLVAVAFSSATDGYGLTSDGAVVATSSGGASWTGSANAPTGTSICPIEGAAGVGVVDQQGDVWTGAQGAWSRVLANHFVHPPISASLACGASTLVESAVAGIGPDGSEDYQILASSDRGARWRSIAQNGPQTGANTLTMPVVGAVAVAPGDSIVTIGYSAVTPTGSSRSIRLARSDDGGVSFTRQDSAPLAGGAPTSQGWAVVHGVAFASPTDGWVVVDTSVLTTTGSPDGYQTEILRTSDGRNFAQQSVDPSVLNTNP